MAIKKAPPKFFRAFIDDLEDKLGVHAKEGFNKWTGILGKKDCVTQSCIYTTSIEEVAAYVAKYDNIVPEYIGNGIYRVVSETNHVFTDFNLCIYQQMIESSHRYLNDMIEYIGGRLLRISTDCIIVQDPVKLGKNNKYVEKPNEIPNWSKFELSDKKFNICHDDRDRNIPFERLGKDELPDWKDGCLLTGGPGCGKTHTIMRLCQEMDKEGKKYRVLAPTNKAVGVLRKKDIIKPSTIHSFLGIVNGVLTGGIKAFRGIDYIIIDEISMVGKAIYKLLYPIKMLNKKIKFIFVGDFDQLPPVEDFEIDYLESGIVWDFCGKHFELTFNYRAKDDPEFVKLLEDVTKIDKKNFGNKRDCRVNLCYFNTTRKRVNQEWMMKECGNDYIELKAGGSEYSQDMRIYKGLPVISIRNGGDVYNNETFDVVSVGDKIRVANIEHELEYDHETFVKLFIPSYCCTVHKAQGSTIDEEFCIWDFDFMNKKMIYTALSRSTHSKKINIC